MLAEALGWEYAEGCLAGDINKFRVIFRYGNSVNFGHTNPYGGFVINPSRAIELSANKLRTRTRLLENDIPVPAVYDINGISHIQKYPVIARPFHHSQGRGFHICNNASELNRIMREGYYAQDIVEKQDEFRLFILNSKIIEASVKEKARANADMMIRNHRRGWKFSRIRVSGLDQNLKYFCVSASKVIGLNWCAVDACLTPNKIAYVFEVNSAPGLIPRKAQKLAEKISLWITEEKGIRLTGPTPPHIEDEIPEAPEAQITSPYRTYLDMLNRLSERG